MLLLGPPSDLVFQKLSTLCARMMFYTETELDLRLGWAMMDDIARDYSYSDEQQTYQDAVRNIKNGYSGQYTCTLRFRSYLFSARVLDYHITTAAFIIKLKLNQIRFLI